MGKPTAKQEGFAREYVLNGRDATKAYRKVYSASKMKPETIAKEAHKLLKNPNVAPIVEALLDEVRKIADEQFKVDASFVLNEAVEMYRMAKGEIESQVMIRDIDSEGGSTQYAAPMKLTNMPGMGKALEIIGKHVDIGAFEKDSQVNVGITVIDPFAKQDGDA